MKKNLTKEWKEELPEEQEDALLGSLMRQKFDAELRRKWSAQLAEQGVRRQAGAKVAPLAGRARKWLAAAAVVAMAAIALWLFMEPTQPASASMAQDFLTETAAQATQTRMGIDTVAGNALWDSARDFYAEKKFAEAAGQLETLAQTQPLDAGQAYLLALCYLQTTPPLYDKSLAQLEAARQANTRQATEIYPEEIEWLTALALVKKGELTAAAAQLSGIVRSDGWYAAKAAELLQELNK